MKFWPFPIIRSYKAEPWLTDMTLRFADASDLKVLSSTQHHMTVVCSIGEFHFWQANRFYGYAMQGYVQLAGGNKVHWCDAQPSRYAVRRLYRELPRAFDNAIHERKAA